MRKRTKFLFLRLSIILSFAILGGRLWYIQVVMGSYYQQQGDTSKIRLEPVSALRGIIYDRNGRQLVWNAPSWSITIIPNAIPSSRSGHIYHLLSGLMHGTPSPRQIATIVSQNTWRGYAPVTIKPDVAPATAMAVMQLHLRLPGVRAEPSSVRRYVGGGTQDPIFSMSHIMGYTGVTTTAQYKAAKAAYPKEHTQLTDQTGYAGIEAALDPYLHGINGTSEVEVDSGERPVRTLRKGHTVSGDSVYLTIDWKLQREVSQDVQAALAEYHLRRGVAIVEDVRTGEILSMVSLPSFNDNWFSGGISQARYNTLLRDPAHPLDDLAIDGQFPPGSVYKLVTAAAAMGTHVVNPSTTYDDTGEIDLCSVYDPTSCQIYHGWKAGGLGSMNLINAIAESSDIYFYTVAGGNPNLNPDPPHIGANRLARYARLYGLGSPTGIELPGEAAGFVPSATWFDQLKPTPYLKNKGDSWHIGDTYNMAIGQGFDLTTPLQVVNYTSMVANGGTLYRPRIVERITGRVVPKAGSLKSPRVLQPFVPQIIRRDFIPASTLALIRRGMYMGTHEGFTGTSYEDYDPRIAIAGKTGTAENSGTPHAWWTGFAPYNNPKIAVTVLVPNANAEGAEYAAPIAHKIFEDYFHLKPMRNLLGLTPGLNTDGSNGQWLTDVIQQLVGSGGSQ